MKKGITPAGAGKTFFQFVHDFMLQDHPRRCGENRATPTKRKSRLGSPPQVRGKPLHARKAVAV